MKGDKGIGGGNSCSYCIIRVQAIGYSEHILNRLRSKMSIQCLSLSSWTYVAGSANSRYTKGTWSQLRLFVCRDSRHLMRALVSRDPLLEHIFRLSNRKSYLSSRAHFIDGQLLKYMDDVFWPIFALYWYLFKRKRKKSDSVLWKNPYTNSKFQNSKVTTQKRHQNPRLHNDWERTKNGQLE